MKGKGGKTSMHGQEVERDGELEYLNENVKS